MTEPKFEVITGKPELQTGNVFDDLDALRKASKLTVKRNTILTDVTVGRPNDNSYFRAHPDWQLDDSTIIKDKDTGRYYFVLPAMREHPKLAPRLRWVTLAAIMIWPANTVQIWPVPADGDFKPWKSQRVAYELSRDQWTQIAWVKTKGEYAVETAEGINHLPIWPEGKTYNDLLKLGFDGTIIGDEEHDYVRQLRGLSD
jgi:hypothetical protein